MNFGSDHSTSMDDGDAPGGRARRTAANRSSKARNLIAEARKRQAAGLEINEEAAVYDVVDDAQYSKLVAERREAAGDWQCWITSIICMLYSMTDSMCGDMVSAC